MSDSVMVWFAIAVLLFWSMGAYNRLMRLRSQGIVAFAALEGLLNQYVLLVKTNFPDAGVADSLPDASQGQDASAAAWAGLAAAAEQFNASLKVAHVQPLNGAPMAALRTALQTLCLSWSRLRDLPPDLAGPALPGTLQSQWEHVALQVEIARTEFNRRVVNYNEAIAQFPALLLAWVFGFKPAQPI
ncbi:MAG: LemA family protein [Rhodoferax sp.]|nr:LemA family protein [Rhodoferax sp.]